MGTQKWAVLSSEFPITAVQTKLMAMMSSIVVKDKVPSHEVKHALPILALSIAALSQALG